MLKITAPIRKGEALKWKLPCEILGSISLVGAVFLRFFGTDQPANLKEAIGLFASILSYYFLFIKTREEKPTISNLMASSFSLAAAIFSMEITGGVKSPILLYVFSVIICLPFKIPPFTAVTYSSLTLAIISAQTLSANVELASLIFKFIILFTPFILIFTFLISKKLKEKEQESQQALSKEEYFEEKSFIYKLWELLDFLEDIPRASDEKELITSFLKYLGTSLGSKDILLVFKSKRKIIQYKLSDGELVGSEVSAYFNFDSVKKQPTIELSENINYVLLENYPNVSVYTRIPSEASEENLYLVRIAADLFLRKIQEMELSSRKNILYEEILSLSELAESIVEEEKNREILEKSVNSLRVYSHIEKALGFFCIDGDEPDKLPDKDSWIIKGRYIKHPEEFWINDFIAAARESIRNLKPITRAVSKGSSNVFVVPVISKNNCIAVLGGVTSLKTDEIRKVIEFTEIVASLLSSSLSHLQALRSLKTENKAKLAAVYEAEKAIALLSRLSEQLSDSYSEASIAEKPFSQSKKLSSIIYNLIFDLLSGSDFENQPEIIESAINALRSSLGKREFDVVSRIAISKRISPENGMRICRIVIPLVLNSFLHSESTRCHVNIEEEDGNLRIVVRDEGKGFDVREVIDAVKKNPEKYTGFKQVSYQVKEMNGRLKIRSSPGRGTEVIIYIPMHQGSS